MTEIWADCSFVPVVSWTQSKCRLSAGDVADATRLGGADGADGQRRRPRSGPVMAVVDRRAVSCTFIYTGLIFDIWALQKKGGNEFFFTLSEYKIKFDLAREMTKIFVD